MRNKLAATYLEWRRKRQVGCRFAIVAAANPVRYRQKVEVAPASGTPAQVAKSIAARIDKMLADPGVQAAAVVLAGVTTLQRAAEVFVALGEEPKWTTNRTALEVKGVGDMVAFNISREIPFGNGTCPSEALVMGPFADFPATRRAPVTAIELFVGTPLSSDPGSGKPTVKAHLAHMDMPMLTQKAFNLLWEKTRSGRLESLNGVDDPRAKAKVSFVIPLPLAKQIGCAP